MHMFKNSAKPFYSELYGTAKLHLRTPCLVSGCQLLVATEGAH